QRKLDRTAADRLPDQPLEFRLERAVRFADLGRELEVPVVDRPHLDLDRPALGLNPRLTESGHAQEHGTNGVRGWLSQATGTGDPGGRGVPLQRVIRAAPPPVRTGYFSGIAGTLTGADGPGGAGAAGAAGDAAPPVLLELDPAAAGAGADALPVPAPGVG